jgi:hypothetical protein
MAPRVGMGVFDAYYEGDHRLAFATARFREAFGVLFASIADNWCPLVVDSTAERLEVQGFRFGKQPGANDRAWELWQGNGLDAASDMLHEEAIKLGAGYWLVEPGASRDDLPRITFEHPCQAIVAHAPGNLRERLAGLKKWVDDDGFAYANVYLPDRVAKYRSSSKPRAGSRIQWQPIDSGSNPLGEVPLVEVPNVPTALRGGRSDLKVILPLQDALNKLLSDMLIGSEYQAFPQRVLLGVELPRDPVTGQPTPAVQLMASQSRLWNFDNEEGRARIDQFDAADLNNYVNVRQHLVRGLTAKTRTPPHYVLGEIVNASGDALTAAETGLVSKTRRKMRPFGERHEDTIRLGFLAMGDKQSAEIRDSETIWRNPESRNEGQAVDAATKLKQLNLPDEVLWERIGMSPQEIARAKALQAAEELLNPTPPPVPPPNGAAPPEPGANGTPPPGRPPMIPTG